MLTMVGLFPDRPIVCVCVHFFNLHLRMCSLIFFSERGREGEREEEKHPCKKEISISYLLYMPDWGLNLQPSGLRDNSPIN